MMKAIERFAALASAPRLAVFRLLIQTGPEGVRAGEIAQTIGAPANTTSNHLAVLTRTGLATSRRDGRSIIYAADYEAARALIGFLIEDCCAGRPEICAPLFADGQPICRDAGSRA